MFLVQIMHMRAFVLRARARWRTRCRTRRQIVKSQPTRQRRQEIVGRT